LDVGDQALIHVVLDEFDRIAFRKTI